MSQFDDDLRLLGFMSYADYLKSPLWAGIRQKVYEQKGRICLDCKSHRATQIHHRQYGLETLKGETLNYLVPVCRACHQAEHGLGPAKPSVAPIVIPWNPKQRCPSKKTGNPSGRTGKAREQFNAGRKQKKRAQRRARDNDRMTRPGSVVCKECRATVWLPPEIAWVDYVCDRCKRHALGVARSEEERQLRREARERSEQAIRDARAAMLADKKTPSGALRDFVKRDRMP